MAKVVLSLGSNRGDRYSWMKKMEEMISSSMIIGKKSPLYETEPIGVGDEHASYLNKVILGSYDKDPHQLLALFQEIERVCGRTGKGELLPRTADIDILLFEDSVIESELLTIPHHALLERRFSLEGAQFVVPEWILPNGQKIGDITLSENILSQGIKVID